MERGRSEHRRLPTPGTPGPGRRVYRPLSCVELPCVVRGAWCVGLPCGVRGAWCMGLRGGLRRRPRMVRKARANKLCNSRRTEASRYSSSAMLRTRHSVSAADPNAIQRCLPNCGCVASAYPSTMFVSIEITARLSWSKIAQDFGRLSASVDLWTRITAACAHFHASSER